MNPFPMGTGVKVWLSTGYTDMRCGFPSLALRVQDVLKHDPLSGHLFVFRGRRSDILKIIWHDGLCACLFTRRLEKGRFIWPNMEGGAVAIALTN
ncbi:IS66 family insertion sequence element accessory protein TnpB [Sinorhizobium meliloti]|uniref:IS66 family insertion sequence element accessory protein TnpB n=1 Tax=Rhizobium meliloti TaxID=382 RepID=UPI001E5D53F5|nr:IS66 family insertion sequence element accessory protein TnpB [Sinorhizobium meliloti]UFX13039.1 IS66 family insertion sequence element accessory protein TnpB [Sinorhizobium meliloti]